MTILLLAALGLAALGAIGIMARIRLRLASEHEAAITEFYKAAQKLVKDPKTPEIVVNAIEVFSKNLRKTSVARHAAFRLATARADGELHPGTKALLEAINSMPVASRQLAFQLLMSFVWSVTSRNWLYGGFVRSKLLNSASRKPSTVEEAKPLIDEVTGDLPPLFEEAYAASC